MQVELVSPERILYSGEADMVVARTSDGEIAFLPNHAPFLGLLVPWPVRVITGSEEIVAAVHGGFVEVRDNRVIVLSDVAELADQIDANRARAAREEALQALERASDDPDARERLVRANLRIEVAVNT